MSPVALTTPLSGLPGIGRERAAQLERLSLTTLGELLLHRPRRYEDRRQFRSIRELKLGEPCAVRGKIVAQGLKTFRQRTQSVFEFVVEDGTARLHCRWWNMPFMEKYFAVGNDIMVYGRPTGLKPRTMDHPETEVVEPGEEASIHLDRLVPIYPLTEGLPQRWLRSLLWRALAVGADQLPELWPEIKMTDVPPRSQAIRWLHFPGELEEAEIARRRLALDEFIELQLAIQTRRKLLETRARARACAGDNRLIKPFLAQLGFTLTAAQTRVLRELRRDLAGPHPMRRLIQGDVGSGKTVVAACCALMTIESGWDVMMMAPTEILAEQHFQTFVRWFGPLGVPVALRTSSHPSSRDSFHSKSGPGLAIGTHALLQGSSVSERLGLVIIDEQHKFGVAQREELVRKGRYPHLMILTATPIPRTLGLTLYGDLDVSRIDERPALRGRVKTFVRGSDKLPKVWEFIRGKLAEGRQAYVVYPRVDEESPSDPEIKAVKQEYERLRTALAPFQPALVHGRLRREEKENVMTRFRKGEVHALLATSIIEVGMDVPNATVMLVVNADHFGLVQLHQLRGRIGRGEHDAFCIFVADIKTPGARQRLQVLEETTDGFRIAEADLAMRGPGELLGRDQSGLPSFRFGHLASDGALIERARGLAARLLAIRGVAGSNPHIERSAPA